MSLIIQAWISKVSLAVGIVKFPFFKYFPIFTKFAATIFNFALSPNL